MTKSDVTNSRNGSNVDGEMQRKCSRGWGGETCPDSG